MGFSCDFKELKNYIVATQAFEDDFNYFLRNFLGEMANRVIAKTKPRTPKDTGALRGAWQLGNIRGVGQNLEIEILNPMEYATDVEYGHRGVFVPTLGKTLHVETRFTEGRFMLKISIDEVKTQMPLRYEKAFYKFCKEIGIEWR